MTKKNSLERAIAGDPLDLLIETGCLMTVKDAARHVGKSEGRVRQLFDIGELTGVRIPNGPRLIKRRSADELKARTAK